MSQTTLTLSMLGSVATSLVYLHVGRVLNRRQVSPEARLANNMFVLWWMGLGVMGLFGAAMLGLYMAGGLRVWFYQAYTSFVLMLLFALLWGLQFYLVYLYTGSRRAFAPLGVFYAVLALATMALIEYAGTPQAITDNGWSLQTLPRVEFGQAFTMAFLLVLVGPQMAAAIAYARLYRKARDRTQRYRIALVTTAILVWFGSSLVATALEANRALGWQLLSRVIGLLGALTILAAYKPPTWVRQRYGIQGIERAVPESMESLPAA